MAKRKRPSPRSGAAQRSTAGAAAGSGPRRLGGANNQRQAPSSSAQRRMARRRQQTNRTRGMIAVGLVVIAVLALILVKVVGGSSGSGNSATSERNPPPADPTVVRILETVPASTFNAVGIGEIPEPFQSPKKPPHYGTATKPTFVYYGAEFCPYCAVMRWALVTALSRFGTFTGLKQIESDSSDVLVNVPTFSFHGATYRSPYLTFSSTEYADRAGNAFETPPTYVLKAVEVYDFPPYTSQANESGIPFLDVAGKYYSSGVSEEMQSQASALQNGGPGRVQIAKGIADPSSSLGKGVGGALTIAQANWLSAAICATDGDRPASVCKSSGVMVALKGLKNAPVVG